MNKFTYSLSLCLLLTACTTDARISDKGTGFSNPILAGFYPDPSICRVDSSYYLVTSTFAYFPGIPVFKSGDLVHWKLIGYVMQRSGQMDTDGLGVSRGIFAPAIRYHNGVFYVTCTLVDRGGNFVVTARAPQGPWSDPVWIPEINGIDPSLYFDQDSMAYIVYNSIPPDDEPLYEGHRTIRMYEFDTRHLEVAGEETILVNGGVDITKKPVWIEGPHLFKKNGYYFLIAAEGGTGDQHSEVVFRSRNIRGPYVPYDNNPILTQRNLNPMRRDPITSTGHADFVETDSGDWWAVFLGCRPYQPVEDNYYNTGRETFLAPVKWIDGWPVINPGFDEVQYHYPFPVTPQTKSGSVPYSGNFIYRDEFDKPDLDLNWEFLRTPHETWYDLSRRDGFLAMNIRPGSCADSVNPSFLGRRQQHLKGRVTTAIEYSPASENEKAGLLVFQNERHFYLLCKTLSDDQPVVALYKSINSEPDNGRLSLIRSQMLSGEERDGELLLRISAGNDVYAFYYGTDPDNMKLLADKVDAKFLSTRVAGGFVGCMYALYATSLGRPSDNTAFFDWFEYQGDDEIYK